LRRAATQIVGNKISFKKSFYELLAVEPNAPLAEIQTAHQRETQKIRAENAGLNAEDMELKLKLLNMAFQTPSNPASRKAYDAQLNPPAELTLVPISKEADVMTLKAEAISLRADAASLKAEAALLKADALSRQFATTPQDIVRSAGKGAKSALKSVLTILGGVLAAGMALQVIFYLMVGSGVKRLSDEEEKAQERVMIQQYYQEHGVRPANRAEVELLKAENRRTEIARREAERAEREAERGKKEKESEYRQFVEESRREGREVSESLRRAEEHAARVAREEAEQQKRAAQMEQQQKEENDRRRIAAERRKLGLE
jgi:hypothetical protein